VKKFLVSAFASSAFAAALFVGPSAPFSAIPVASAVDIVCSDGSNPTCSPIYNADGKIVGYSCIC
jgi:hypothetical protein